ncbi:hypothetical protein ACB092_12G005900 [Castanea dentata]
MYSAVIYEHPAIILDNLELETSHCHICHLGAMLFHLGALIGCPTYCVGLFLECLNQYNCIKASIASGCPSAGV